MMIAEKDKQKIKEFFELTVTDYTLRKYHKPVLVYEVVGDKVHYSLWEEEILERYGLKNVDGWDKTENIAFCPDWMRNDVEEEEEELEDIDLDEDDVNEVKKYLNMDDLEA